ncbi:hypothetical protein Tco_0717488 [Tanacetum coccineum]
MAQQVIPAAQLVPRYDTIGRCNNYVMLQSIPCSPKCKIVGHILLDHPISYALTTTADVPVVYLQQFWRIVSKVPDTEDTIKFMLDTKEFTYTVDMFRVTLYLLVETPENPFVTPVNIQTIKAFMNMVGYQGVVDKKKEAIQYPRFIKLIIADLMKKFPDIPQRVDEDYHSIKDDTPLVSVYTTGNVLVRGMMIPDEFLTKEIRATDDFKEYETVFFRVNVPMNQPQPVVSTQGTHRSTPRAYRTPTVSTASPQGKKRKQTAGESSSPHKSLKITIRQKQVVEGEKDDDSEDRCASQNVQTSRVIQNMEQKCVTTKYFWKTHKKVDQVLHEIVPQLAEKAIDDLIENNLKPSIVATIIEDRDAFHLEVPDLVSQEFNAQTPKIIEELFKNYVQSNVIQVHPTITTSTETTSSADLQQQLDDDIHSQRHDGHQEDDAPPEGENRVKRHKESKSSKSARGSSSKHLAKDSTTYVSKQQQQQQEWDAWVEETVIDDDGVIPKDETPELIIELQNVDKHVPTIFNRARMEATLNDMISNQFKNAKEYAYQLEQTTNFMENRIVWESRQEDIRRPVPRPLVFFGPQRNPNEPPRYLYNKNLFFLKNENTEEKKYILSLYKIHAERFPEVDLEEKMNCWVRKEFKNFNEDA